MAGFPRFGWSHGPSKIGVNRDRSARSIGGSAPHPNDRSARRLRCRRQLRGQTSLPCAPGQRARPRGAFDFSAPFRGLSRGHSEDSRPSRRAVACLQRLGSIRLTSADSLAHRNKLRLRLRLIQDLPPVRPPRHRSGMRDVVHARDVAPAVANAVYHATGKQIRSMPLRKVT